MKTTKKVLATALAGSLAASVATIRPAWSADDVVPQIVVVGTTPVPGMRVDADKVPGSVQTLKSSDLRADGAASVVNGMNEHIGGVNINDTLADPFQPDILYRGFEASPVLGTPQGLAVYQSGVRINEAFGDTVNWDLFPDIAVDRIDIVSANPLFGLNALGGAVSVTMKNGFTYHGADGEFQFGSFNQRQGSVEIGGNDGTWGFYGAARVLGQDGWRAFQHDSVHQYYLDGSYHSDVATFDLSYTRADNKLNGQGVAPLQSLALDRRNVFTGPQNNVNHLNFVTLNGDLKLTDTIAAQTVLYVRNYTQTVSNGDNSDYTACTDDDAAGLLCQGDGATPLMSTTGSAIPDITDGGATIIGQNDYERIRSNGYGGSLQFTSSHAIARFGNEFAAGFTFDTSQTNFQSGTQVGVLSPQLTVLPSPYYVDTPEGGDFSATPVDLNANTKYYGFYLTDTFDVTAQLSVTASARYNIAKVDLTDQIGSALSGNNRFTHLNPAIGATYKILPTVTVYGGYSTNNRAPTASEIECSNPETPCLLPSDLASDPPNLKQVIAHTMEVGVRGHWDAPSHGGHLTWSADVFRTNSENDIYGISTSISTGFFQNVGSTRRQGFEAGLNYQASNWSAYAQYSYIDATFRSALTLNSPANPAGDDDGNIFVVPGDHLPLIPLSRLKLGGDYSLLPQWSVGASLVLATAAYYRGDEANQLAQLPGYHVVNLRTSYHVTPKVELYATVQNLFDEFYSNVGILGDPTGVGAPGIPPAADGIGPGVDPRFQSPGMPRAYFGGFRVRF
jgi:iron complex outermembrane receptor protein